ncbi:MAG: zf-HC2 domain-containing protein [Clostridiales bacterium]|jgi:anti-sigma factor RsiW|nr:zf-HC2 domain-containing protein [Clostridiales bacterium]
MECEKAGGYMMKYMDGVLAEPEALWLNKHILQCEHCKEDFFLYDHIMEHFAKMPLCDAPANFEERVMARIRLLPAPAALTDSLERAFCGIWGVFFVLMALGLLLGMSKDAVIAWLSERAGLALAPLAALMASASDDVTRVSNLFLMNMSQFLTRIWQFFSGLQVILLIAMGLLILVQIVLYKKDKVDTAK